MEGELLLFKSYRHVSFSSWGLPQTVHEHELTLSLLPATGALRRTTGEAVLEDRAAPPVAGVRDLPVPPVTTTLRPGEHPGATML